MPPLDRLLWRLFVAALGWLAAVIASLAVLTIAATVSVVPATQAFVEAPDGALQAGFGVLVTGMLHAVALGPTLVEVVWPTWFVAALLAEIVGSRSLLVHVLGAAAIAAGGLLVDTPPPDAAAVRVILAAGFVAGFAHWLVAGRSAGVGRRTDAGNAEGDTRPPHA